MASKRKSFYWKHPSQIRKELDRMKRNYEITINISDQQGMCLVKLCRTDGGRQTVEFVNSSTITADEMAMVAIINESLARILNGKVVNYNAELPSFSSQEEVVKCEWLRSGNLKVHGPTDKQYHYVDTEADALLEPRTFTCPRRLLPALPKHKQNITQLAKDY